MANYRTVQFTDEVIAKFNAVALHMVNGNKSIQPSPAKTAEALADEYIKNNSVQLQA